MKLQTIFDQLSMGEFSQLSFGGQPQGTINEANYRNALVHINLALTQLFKRFSLRIGQVELQLIKDRLIYDMASQYAVSNIRSRETQKYILDTEYLPFKDDLLKVTKLITAGGVELELNGSSNLTCKTLNWNTLYIPKPIVNQDVVIPEHLHTSTITVQYQSNHPAITIPLGFFDPARVEVDLPDTHLLALLYFVASRVHNPMGMTNEFHAGNTYAAKYEQECAQLEAFGLEIDQDIQHNRAAINGWF